MQLDERIYHDLSGKIDAGAVPCPLTLSALAEHYGVSATPVRAAISRLVDEGHLCRTENGRLDVVVGGGKNDRRAAIGPLPAETPDIEEKVRLDVINMSLRGESGFVREEATAERHSIGRTALRPILARLGGAGLLERSPRRGWRVHPFDPGDLDDFLEIRELLECRALRVSRAKLDPVVLEELLRLNRIAEQDQGALDNRLHGLWIEGSQNKYLQSFFARDAVYYASVFDFAAPESHHVTEMAAQHCEILEALIEQRWKAASQALAKHIRAQKPIVLSLVEKLKASE